MMTAVSSLARAGGEPGAPPQSGEVSILLVESSPEDARAISDLLESRPGSRFRVDRAGSLAEGIRRLAAGPVDAVILNLDLPDGRGLEALVTLQAHDPALPVLALTATEDEALAERALRQGAQDYLLKAHLDRRLLVRAVRYSIERKRAENALRRSEERFELMARATNDVVWDWDLLTNRLWWNVGVRSFLGYPPDHVGSDPNWWHEHIHPEDRSRVTSGMRSVIDGGGRFWMDEHRYRCADGSYAVVFDRGYVIHDEQWRPVRMIGAMMDITDRKRAEEALRETNDTLRTLVLASPMAITLTDADEKIRIWNPAAEQLFQWAAPDVVGKPLSQVIAPGRLHEFRRLCRQVLDGQSLMGADLPGLRRDGTPVDLNLSMGPLRDARGRVSGLMALLQDVTERNLADQQRAHLEAQLRQSQKMEAVGRLAGGVAHDFNNLLTAISGYAELLQGLSKPGEQARDYADEILKSALRASSLTRQLLAFSRRQVLQPRVLDLNGVISGMEGLLRRLIGEDVDFTARLAPDLWSVRADQNQIEQVIMNLAVNARDAMPSGGKLTVETRNLRLGRDYTDSHGRVRTGPHVVLAVSDTGCGMDAEVCSHLFEPFFTTKEQGKGTGLGLATVYGIVKQSGGDIWVYSEPGRGSAFKIYLPAVEAPADPAAPDTTRRQSLRGTETILLVEDAEVVRRLLREILVQSGYKVLLACDGEEAIRISREHAGPIDLLITDVVMPRVGGRELAAQLSSDRPDLNVLYMSGYTEEAVSNHGILDPGSAFLEKPFSPDVLARKVRSVLERNGGGS
jgi:PAS domain S-box-containing protein